jgi:hypothetical protein
VTCAGNSQSGELHGSFIAKENDHYIFSFQIGEDGGPEHPPAHEATGEWYFDLSPFKFTNSGTRDVSCFKDFRYGIKLVNTKPLNRPLLQISVRYPRRNLAMRTAVAT